MASTTQDTAAPRHSVLDSKFPVLLPHDASLFMPEAEFQAFVKTLVGSETKAGERSESPHKRRASDPAEDEPQSKAPKSPFIDGLLKDKRRYMDEEDLRANNKTLTANADATNISSKNPLVDLFYDLGDNAKAESLKIAKLVSLKKVKAEPLKKVKAEVLKKLLDEAWDEDPLMTLKIIFSVRSIHLGKSNRFAAYNALGWLSQNHPLTLLANLKWLVRPVIQKTIPKKEKKDKKRGAATDKDENKGKGEEDDDFEMVDADEDVKATEIDPDKAYDVRFGVSHGYWKDLLNLVALAANNELKVDGDPASLLLQKSDKELPKVKRKREWDAAKAKELRQQKQTDRYQQALQKLETDGFYHALCLTVARLFATQLREDAALLQSEKPSDKKKISLAAKWSPTFGEFHDKHTMILSYISEALFPEPALICPDATNRELYLRHARELLRKKIVSPLRKALSVVEREIAANNFEAIKYQTVPSLAMQRYSGLFIRKDFEHFAAYIKNVAEGSAQISGAVLLPSTLVSKAMKIASKSQRPTDLKDVKAMKKAAADNIMRDVIDGQWKSLVQRIRDSGVLESSIAVCDVSGSMNSPIFKDGSAPMDSSIGLSLLLAEVTKPPFGGALIAFSEEPHMVKVGGEHDPRGLVEKVHYIDQVAVGYNTNFTAVFEKLILPMAKREKLKKEDMVKQVFVFSDMQFDEAEVGADTWSSSYERIKALFEAEGYDIPTLVFWNLAADSTSKPVTNDDIGTRLVSGYSQGMLKSFLDAGGFKGDETELVEKLVEGEDGMMEVTEEKKKMNPLAQVEKAVSHIAFSMLTVED
ncbi:hypothetical protein P154DRAFT_517102 [Amniculicola lignicola CBS 123094]|uniref:Uncharacterized protein n=1 Tax=Amniculicola lignicola CBS 123094 TaxID=1392246 RepID=A0A6A5X367_9PLEO|nr:hypothetical protein P154DRAFT_517102 [Amniculicola lignicola CBS 123094]